MQTPPQPFGKSLFALPLLPVGVTLALTAFQLFRLVLFINVYGGIEHDSGWLLGVSRTLAEHGAYGTMVATLDDPRALAGIDTDGKFDIQDNDGHILFFTGAGIGPASVVPDALILKLFGTDFWALRLGPLLFYTLMLLLAARILYELAGLGAVVLFHAFLFFYPNLSVFLGYEAMGEVPTMCYLLLAYLIFAWALSNPSRMWRGCFVAGLVAGLAVNAKFIALLSVGGLYLIAPAAVFASRWKHAGRSIRGHFAPVLALGLGMAVPLLLWEVVQFVTIVSMGGFDVYQQHLAQRWRFVVDDGSGLGQPINSGLEFQTYKFFLLSQVSHPEHWVTALVFLALLLGGVWLGWRWRASVRKGGLFAFLWLGWLANTVWFVGLAKTGWVRHFWFGLVLAAMLLSVVAVSLLFPVRHGALAAVQPSAPARRSGVLRAAAGLALLALLVLGFLSQPHTLSLTISDALVADWRQIQIDDPYGARLPWIIVPRAAQQEVVDFIKDLPSASHVYYDGQKAAELPVLTGRMNYAMGRRTFMLPQRHDVLVLGPSVQSPWMSPEEWNRRLPVVKQLCQRPLLQNDYYILCGLAVPPASGIPEFTPVGLTFQNGIQLLGYDTYKTSYRPGESFQVSLYWQTSRKIAERFKAFVHLVGTQWNPVTNNPLWGQRDQDPGDGSQQTTSWNVGSTIEDQYLFRIASDTPPGTYQLEVGMYRADTGERLPIVAGSGTTDHAVLFEVAVHP